MRRMRRRNVGCAAKGTMPRSWLQLHGRRAGDGERGDHRRDFGVVLLSKKLCQTSPGASRFSFQVRWAEHSFIPLFTLLRYEKNMRIVGLRGLSICLILAGWGCSWLLRKARTSQTFRGSGCRGGHGGRLRRTVVGLANRFPKASLQTVFCIPVPVFQVPPVIKNIGHVKRKFHEVIGDMRCGPARRWVQSHLDVRKTSGKRWLRFFKGSPGSS